MPTSESTCWTVIHAAAAGSPADREGLAGPLPRRRQSVPGSVADGLTADLNGVQERPR